MSLLGRRLFPGLLGAGLASGLLAIGGAGSFISSVVPPGDQYKTTSTALVVSGGGFVSGSKVAIDNVEYPTTVDTASQLTVTVPSGLIAGSPVRTSGVHVVTVNTGGTANWSVTSWHMQTNGTGRSRYFEATPSDCAGAAPGARFSPWTDRLGNGDLAQATGALRPQFVANQFGIGAELVDGAAIDPVELVHDGVYLNSDAYADLAGANPLGDEYLVVIGAEAYFDASDGFTNSVLWTSGSAWECLRVGGTRRLRWNHTQSGGAGVNTVDSALFPDQAWTRFVMTVRRYGGSSVSITIHTATGLGTPVTNSGGGGSIAPGTVRLGARGTSDQGWGGRPGIVHFAAGSVTLAEEQRAACEALVKLGIL